MKLTFLTFTISVLSAWPVLAQDPGSQDSVIVEDAIAAAGDTLVVVSISAETDDPVAFYNLPLEFDAPLGGFSLDSVYVVPDPPVLSLWDETYYDYVENGDFIRMFGFWDTGGDDNPPMNTGNERISILNLVFRVEPNTPDQYVAIGQAIDPVSGPVKLGLSDGLTGFAPAFVPGVVRYGNPMEINGQDDTFPDRLLLSQNYPNPFNPRTTIQLYLPEREYVMLAVYNLMGQRVKALAGGVFEAGSHAVLWDGTNETGSDVPSGVYFCRLSSKRESRTISMILIR